MARNTRTATLIGPESSANAAIDVDVEVTALGDRDSEAAWDTWIDDLRSTENSGTIRAYKLSVGEDGSPNYGKGSKHALLGSWPHQMYDLDSLSEKLRKEFMEPGETAWFKVTGTTQGKSGTMCSQVVKLIRSKSAENTGPESLTQLFQLMQQGQERNAQMLREIIRPADAPVQAQGKGLAETAKEFAAILVPVLGPVLAALIARPAKPATDFGAMVDAMRSMKGFITGNDEEGNSNDTPTVAIIKSIAPALPQLLQILQQRNVAPVVAPRISAPAINQQFLPDAIPSGNPPRKIVDAVPTPKPASFAVPTSNPQQGVDKEMLDILKPQLEQLADVAAAGESAKDAAHLVVSMLQGLPQAERILQTLSTLVEDKAAFQRLAVLAPKIRAHADWFEQFRVELESILFEDDSQPSGDSG